MADEVIVLITASSETEAATIARALVDEHLIACANLVPGVRSFFFWEGKTRDEREVLLICKSRMPVFPEVIARVKSLHSYTVPEIIALPIAAGSQEYLHWVKETVKG
jgi:periplasmic divalent cation tolerance protein